MRRARGFTLAEMLVAIAVLLGLVGAILSFLFGLMERRAVMLDAGRDAQAGTVIIDRIEADMLAGLAGGGRMGAGIQGQGGAVRLLTRGVSLSMAGVEEAAGGGQVMSDLGDLQGSEYRFDETTGSLEARRWNGEEPGDSSFEIVSERVERFRLRYFDGRRWRSTFDSGSNGGLPVAIEVSLWFGEAGGAPADEIMAIPGGDLSDAEGSSLEELLVGETGEATVPVREPDRTRIIIMPDGPSATWGGGPSPGDGGGAGSGRGGPA
jgi:prepilin-type N-terminal cleavage/methylation domain-containing protein